MPEEPEEYYNLGPFTRPITTPTPLAQTWFTRGLIWCYGFNHEEAASCFSLAIDADPACAMANWGLAYALGPNYNLPWDALDAEALRKARGACAKAELYAGAASAVERGLIAALKVRYQASGNGEGEGEKGWNEEYAEAMGRVYGEFGEDADVAALYADALMNLTPWKLWDLRSGLPAEGARTLEIKQVLEKGLSQTGGLSHPGILHLYIHLMEMSSTPEAALAVSDNLRGLVPDAGHLNHMPSHIDIMCGDYRHAIACNTDGINADRKFLARAGSLNFYTLYRSHNYHFKIYAAMFSGQSRIALETSAELQTVITEDLLRVKAPPMADWLEGFLSTHIHVLVRFGRWQSILDEPFPLDPVLYCVTTAMLHYAQGIAFAATSRLEEAQQQQALFTDALTRVPKSRTLFNNTCLDILAIAGAMLDGEIAYRRKDFDVAFGHLRRSVELYDSLPYDEPWGWMQPTRHAYGALLLEQGRVDDALRVYSADLGFDDEVPRALQHPNNVWALHGYHECLLKLGRVAEARIVAGQLKIALATADVEIKCSCFCRLGTVE